jgi:tRNA pseudouridine55 synthase
MEGVLVIDKPAGITSFGVVRAIKKVLKAKKVGHAGTLDPFATGVLPILVNRATRAASFLLESDKEYVATMRLGIETDTQDLTGSVVCEAPEVPFTGEEICKAFQGFIGKIEQIPPPHSAVKYGGIPSYKWVRRGKEVPRKPRTIEVYSIRIRKIDLPHVNFEVVCSKGTYIRTLCADVGRVLGCGAHLTRLRRVRCGKLTVDHAISLRDVRPLFEANLLRERFISIDEVMSGEDKEVFRWD